MSTRQNLVYRIWTARTKKIKILHENILFSYFNKIRISDPYTLQSQRNRFKLELGIFQFMLPVMLFPPLASTQGNLQDVYFWEKQKNAQKNQTSEYSLLKIIKVCTVSNDLTVLFLSQNRISILAILVWNRARFAHYVQHLNILLRRNYFYLLL